MLEAGLLRKQITIQKISGTQDAFGQEQLDWASFATVNASVEPLQGYERQRAAQMEAVVDTKIRMRYLLGVYPKMRVLYESRKFNIVSVIDEEERHFTMELMCLEVV